MTSATPKPSAGEHVIGLTPQDAKQGSALREIMQEVFNLKAADKENAAAIDLLVAERDLLRERERELVEALELVVQHDGKLTGADFAAIQSALTRSRQ